MRMIVTPVSRLAVIDGPGDRGGAAILRQQRGVDVDAAVRRDRQHVVRQDLPVGGDDEQFGLQRLEFADALRAC